MTERYEWLLAMAVMLACGTATKADSLPANPPKAESRTPAPRAAAKGIEIYRSAFGKEHARQWSKVQVTRSPSGQHTFLGPFAYENTTLSLDNLPEHARVRLSFDLMIMLTWDGDWRLDQPNADGPDLFDVTADRGPRLVHASFVAWPTSLTTTQSFPGRFPYDHLPAGTAAAECHSLGYIYPGNNTPDDYVYHIERSFAHAGTRLKITFSGINLQVVSDECWGLDNVRVEVLPAAKTAKLDEAELEKMWTDLGSTDAKKFVPAIDALIDLGEPGAAAIRKRLLEPAPQTKDRRIDALIERLDASAYMVREHAMADLRELGSTAEPALRAARADTMSLEVRVRIDSLLKGLKEVENDGSRRLRRAVEVFELVGGQQARAGLSDIASRVGTHAAWEANAAIDRLDGKAEIPTKLDLPPQLP